MKSDTNIQFISYFQNILLLWNKKDDLGLTGTLPSEIQHLRYLSKSVI